MRVYYEVYGSGRADGRCSCRPGRSSTRGTGRCRSPTSRATAAWSTFDGRGNGRSGPAAGRGGVRRARVRGRRARRDGRDQDRSEPLIVGFSLGGQRGLLLAAEHPERIDGAVFIGPSFPGGGSAAARADSLRLRRPSYDTVEGWAKHNRFHWLRDYRDWVEFFISKMFTEPHSTKPIEDAVGWGLETDAETHDRDAEAPDMAAGRVRGRCCSSVRCPVLVIHGERRRDHAPSPAARVRGADRRRARRARRIGPRAARPRPGQGQSPAARLRRPADAGRALGAR